MPAKPWQDIARIAQEHRDRSIAKITPAVPEVPSDLPANVTNIPKELLSKSELSITESAPENLLANLASGKLASVKVTTAFLRRAGLAQKLVSSFWF